MPLGFAAIWTQKSCPGVGAMRQVLRVAGRMKARWKEISYWAGGQWEHTIRLQCSVSAKRGVKTATAVCVSQTMRKCYFRESKNEKAITELWTPWRTKSGLATFCKLRKMTSVTLSPSCSNTTSLSSVSEPWQPHKQLGIISLYNIDWPVFITEMQCVYYEVRNEFLTL